MGTIQLELGMGIDDRIAEDRRDADTLAVREGPFGLVAARDLCDIQNTDRPALLVLEDELDLGRGRLRDLRVIDAVDATRRARVSRRGDGVPRRRDAIDAKRTPRRTEKTSDEIPCLNSIFASFPL